MCSTMTLTQAQEVCLARMAESRSSEKRAVKNRNAAIKSFKMYCIARGYPEADIPILVQDVRDVYALRREAERE